MDQTPAVVPGKVYLIPNVIAADTQHVVIPEHVRSVLPSLDYFLVEDVRTARRYLSSLKVFPSIEPLQFEVLNKNTGATAMAALFEPVQAGRSVGIISESGCPGVADPGAVAVQYAHSHHLEVVPLVGPSSLLLALMASGLNGQHFAFHGYLPIDSKEAAQLARAFEKESRSKKQTQLFIETPYRNNQLFQVLTKNLADDTELCIAVDVTGNDQSIRTLPIKQWKVLKPEFPKTPAVFLFLAH